MQRHFNPLLLGFATLFMACSEPPTASDQESFEAILGNSPSIVGNTEYLDSPYLTPGDRVYMVGHQNGTFPELGWHIKGEMGGVWDHPIKLLDGFDLVLNHNGNRISLDRADSFVNYPMANQHIFLNDNPDFAVSRWQFVPDAVEGILVELVIENTSGAPQSLTVDFTGYTDLRPTWLGEETGMIDSQDEISFDSATGAWVAKDAQNPWYTLFGSDQQISSHEEQESPYAGMGVGGSISQSLELPVGGIGRIRFAIAGSFESEAAARDTYEQLLSQGSELMIAKRDRYAQLAAQSELRIPDAELQQTFEWLKYNSDWMIQEVPGIGRGITAGIPDYPWWFGVDSEYALRGYMAVGQRDIVHSTIKLLDSVSMAVNGNGKIIHEMSTNGKVFNPGNINETPQFASLIWNIYRWNGDKAFLEKYFPTIEKGMDWLMDANDGNNNGFPDGFGMMEIHGLDSEMIDVAAYTQAAFSDASKIAAALGQDQKAADYASRATSLAEKINDEFWSARFGSYADFMGTDQQALHLIDDAIVRADTLNKPWAIAELEATRQAIRRNPGSGLRPFVLHHNWVVNTPMEVGIADPEKAKVALETARQYTNPFGMFVTGIDRDETAGADEGSFQGSKVFSYTGAVMTLPTGVQTVAENNYGNPDQALDYLKRMTRSFSYALPGSMYEVSPDYGMMAQAWNIFSFGVPIVEQFFGVRPMVSEKRIVLQPQMPEAWPEAALNNVLVGENSVDLTYSKNAEGLMTFRAEQASSDWTLVFPLPENLTEEQIEVRSGTLAKNASGGLQVVSDGAVLDISFTP
ncbi:alpha-L-rhamnosidase [Robiginitalea myxolifaciens]|uniref:Alpha-L-rhamnosidase n=1 Tax=Robiginitalea myxolifaciens TaxID=400055 RepID=A0A1I6G7H0_9FLAO|nr:family 78 glycoside hydrolase catalytic domain [Robiginitalea myxolifaciens]SFR38146.1 alpha-L-rhamnosidase [Robiginitalea myxolifaciens]